MNKKKWLLIGVMTVVLIGILIFSQNFDLLGSCDRQTLQEIPFENFKIETSLVDCGATTDYATHVDLIDFKKGITSKIVVLNADHSSDLKVNWVSSTKVSIEYIGSESEAFNFQNKIGDISFDLTHNK